ncbi:MAG: adenosine kinase [Spirochaetes bacterium]|nr:adenosine kinase [Spirochaetota bacterium]
MKIDISGIGNPLVDILVYVEDEFIEAHGLKKGVMHLIDDDRRKILLDHVKDKNPEYQAGGSCPNTMAALAMLGIKSALAGAIGNDELGALYEEKITDRGVRSFLTHTKSPTGTSIILITPDKERTMNTHLSACRDFRTEDLPVDILKSSSIFYFTGYMWDTENQKEATRRAIEIAKQSGARVVFDVADPMAVERYKEDFLTLIERDADIVLANRKEAELLTGENVEDAVRALNGLCGTAVVKNGDCDTLIGCNGGIYQIPCFKSNVKDTTGAGDNFAAGFLYGLMKKFDIELCGTAAAFVAAKTIEKIGAQAPDDIRACTEEMLEKRGCVDPATPHSGPGPGGAADA